MEKKSEESRSVFWEGLKVFWLVCLLLRPLLSNLKKQPLLMHAYRAVLYILLYSIYLDPRHEFSFFFFVPYYRMNAYMAALLTSSWNIHFKNAKCAWKKAQKNTQLHQCLVSAFYKLFYYIINSFRGYSTLLLLHFSTVKF